MSSNGTSLVGDIVERKPTAKTPPKTFTPAQAGFPKVQHRSKSAFARNREAEKKSGPLPPKDALPPTVQRIAQKLAANNDDWRDQISRENLQKVENMTEEEREQERKDILERFGPEVGEILKRAKLARERQAAMGPSRSPNTGKVVPSLEEVPITDEEVKTPTLLSPRGSPPPPALSAASTRPSSRADRRLRFADIGPQNVHVYESAPPSPRRKVLALPPPDENDPSAVSLGTWSGPRKAQLQAQARSHGSPMEAEPTPPPKVEIEPAGAVKEPPSPMDAEPTPPPQKRPVLIPEPTPPPEIVSGEPEEGSAEYIRRRYFPNAPANDPNLAWMQADQDPSAETDVKSSLRFDLSGKPIPPSISSTLPTHLGLHHHAEGTHAGYTLDDIFLLCRSTVPAQRATMLQVLARIAARLRKTGDDESIAELQGKEEELRKRILAAGVERALDRGSVGARAVEVIWQCVVGWDEEIAELDGVELELSKDAAIQLLKLEEFLPVVATLFAQGEAAEETKVQLLEIIQRLGKQSNEYASAIVATPKLVGLVVQAFLQTPFPPIEGSPHPNPVALKLLTLLTNASRTNALLTREHADTVLRFITTLPETGSIHYHLVISLLVHTLQFYAALAKYGLCSHIASTAMVQFSQLSRYVLSDACASRVLMTAWAELIEAWMICAVDPHRTTPDHEILWSQIIAFGWNTDVQDLQDRLGGEESDWAVWAGAWNATAAWLEGARVNGLRGGSGERMEALEVLRYRFDDSENNKPGIGKEVVINCLNAVQRTLAHLAPPTTADGQSMSLELTRSHLPLFKLLASYATLLTSVIRLWVACLPPVSEGPLSGPPFPLPFPEISQICAHIIGHPVWSILQSAEDIRRFYVFLRPVSAFLSVYLRMSRRLPGIPEPLWIAQVLSILQRLLPGDEEFGLQVQDDLLQLVTPQWLSSLNLPAPTIIWERGGMNVIRPFLEYNTRPRADVSIGPFASTPGSILNATTHRLPSPISLRTFGLPLRREWTVTALDHLLRSGTSEVLKALPPTWDASEVEIVRISLLLAIVFREFLQRFSLPKFMLTREEAAFACMKVFMLEHGQPHNDSSEEVFRDRLVGQLMEELLKPYTLKASTNVVSSNLEDASSHFLDQTPFYQYYTDFVSLYDAISFSNPLFGRLLLPPTSMRYAIDYRRHLWNDFAHILKTIRTPIEQVVSDDLQEYLWPIERDPQMIGCYLRSLLKDQLQGLLHLVALHHLSANIWMADEDGWTDDRARKLLQAVISQSGNDMVREVVSYSGRRIDGALRELPSQHTLGEPSKQKRLQLAQAWGLADIIRALLV